MEKDTQTNSKDAFEIPERVTRELGVLAGKLLEPGQPEKEYSLESARESIEAGIKNAVSKWQKYRELDLGIHFPQSTDQLRRYHRNYEGMVESLAQIKFDMWQFGLTEEGRTPDGKNIGETLEPLLIPWEFFMNNAKEGQLISKLKEMRAKQGIREHVLDYPFILDVEERVAEELYPANGLKESYHESVFSSKEYVDHKFTNEGWWEVALIQSGKSTSVTKIHGEQLYKLTRAWNTPASKLRLYDKYPVNRLGIYEWLALSLQKHPKDLGPMPTALLANHLKQEGKDWLITAGWDEENERVDIGFIRAEGDKWPNPNVNVRLAFLHRDALLEPIAEK